MTAAIELLRPRRRIVGMSAVLLPFTADGSIDWNGFEGHVVRTAEAGLRPAVNMDTGYVHLLSPEQRSEVLGRTAALGVRFVGGAYDERGVDEVQRHGGLPIVFPSPATTGDVVAAYHRIASVADHFLGFELSPVFNPDGRIWDLATFEQVLAIPQCIGAKHSSLSRVAEWDRLRLRDRRRPDFMVLTGNDLAVDMVMYGSDYLLGLSTFAPDLFALRDRYWHAGDDRFHELNDALQWLGAVAFRPPVPAYRHDAAIFLRLRGWIDGDGTPDGAPRRADWEIDLLRDVAERLGVL